MAPLWRGRTHVRIVIHARSFHIHVNVLRHRQEDWLAEYEDHLEMLDSEPSLDAVIVVSHEWLRPKHVRDCLRAGKHVYVHPSLGHDLEGVREMVRAAKRSNRVVQVGYSRRSLPHYRLAKERLVCQDGILDSIESASVARAKFI